MNRTSHYLLLERLVIDSANAISSPITYGFPALSAFLGASHALNRRLVKAGHDIVLSGVLVACHEIEVQRYRGNPFREFTFVQNRLPVRKNGKAASVIEEGKVHLTVSLVLEVNTDRQVSRDLEDRKEEFEQLCLEYIMLQRMAGGSIRNIKRVHLFDRYSENDIKKALLPAFVLMDARADLIDITRDLQAADANATALDALLGVATLHHEYAGSNIDQSGWITRSCKSGRGWLVPIPVGFQAISRAFAPGELANSRGPEYSSQYVEAIHSLGKWLFPTRLPELPQCFWRYKQNDNIFLITQDAN